MTINDLTVVVSLKNDAEITPEMVDVVARAVDWMEDLPFTSDERALAKECLRRMRVVVCGSEAS